MPADEEEGYQVRVQEINARMVKWLIGISILDSVRRYRILKRRSNDPRTHIDGKQLLCGVEHFSRSAILSLPPDPHRYFFWNSGIRYLVVER